MKQGKAIFAGLIAVVFLALGLVLKNQADFSHDYVKSELEAHGITFTQVEFLLPSQKDVPCLVENAGKLMTTGKQAECYAKYQISLDMDLIDNGNPYFVTHYNAYLSDVAKYTAIQADPNDPAIPDLLQASLDAHRKADDMLAGEATKGLLLTAYGFSIIGDRLAQAALACFILAGLSLVIGIVVFIRSNRKPAATSS